MKHTAEDAPRKPGAPPPTTPWGGRVTPENVWAEYPRPQLSRRAWTSLNGLWDYAVNGAADGRPQRWEGKILVPFAVESALSGVGRLLQPDEQLWYRRFFRARPRAGRRVILHFGAVDYRAQVFINGAEAAPAPHVGGNTPFSIDITDLLGKGKEQDELVVAAWDPTDKGSQALGKQALEPHSCFYMRVSGIWQTVWMEEVPEAHITAWRVEADAESGAVEIRVEASRQFAGRLHGVVSYRGKRIAEAEAAPGAALRFTAPAPKKWSPDAPNLYDFTVTLTAEDGAADTARGYFAFRKIEIREGSGGHPRVFLNGVETFMFGTLDQGWWPDGLLTPPSEEAMEHDIHLVKSLGFNMMRKHVKIEPLRYYYLCDKIGLMLWQDMPSGRGDAEARHAEYRRDLRDMVALLRGAPCVVAWVAFNEGWGQPGAAKTNQTLEWLKREDPSRLVDGPSGWTDHGLGDMADAHNYPAPTMPAPQDGRAAVLGEFGGIAYAVPGHMWAQGEVRDEKAGGAKRTGNWGYVSDDDAEASFTRLRGLFAALKPLVAEGLAAAVYTQTADVEIELNGFVTCDRKALKYPVSKVRAMVDEIIKPAAETRGWNGPGK